MTPTHDTAAALWSAIDAYGCDAASNGALGKDATTRAAIDRAITAHVEAEVARRPAAAPVVEAAIEAHGDVCYERGFRHALKSDAVDSELDAAYDRLRAAIAADKARAVEDLLAKLLAGAGIDEQDRPFLPPGEQVDAILRWAHQAGDAYRNARKVHEQLHEANKRIEWQRARPTPDEARRLVEVYRIAVTAHAQAVALIPDSATAADRSGEAIARAALLRALGVEP